jgi:hypothetical protein
VVVVSCVPAAVVDVVDVVTMRDCNMPAAIAVDMRMIDVFMMNCLGHRFSPSFRLRRA